MSVRMCASCGEFYRVGSPNKRGFCEGCLSVWQGQYVIHGMACNRARKLGLPVDLTLEEWISTVEYFQWMCAYCLDKPYEVLEHFIPINLGGGTTYDNCVPSCSDCNKRKKHVHPDCVTAIPVSSIRRIKTFLANKKR